MLVWMKEPLRRGLTWHVIRDRRTICGYLAFGPGGVPLGVELEREQAVELYRALPCRRCAGTAEIVEPRCVPSKDRAA